MKASDSLFTYRNRYPKLNGGSRFLTTESKKFINFVSNDYLGLSYNKETIETLKNALKIYGVGSTGAPTLSGYSKEVVNLSSELANWLGYEKCLIFSSGYSLNVGIFSKIVDRDTHIWLDKNCHASHIDGIMLSGAKFTTFNSENIDVNIQKIFAQSNKRHLILCEGVFSMAGSCNYLHKLIKLKIAIPDNVLLVVDDAHGIGTIGTNGFGSLEQLGTDARYVDLLIGTFGKTFGTHGGFICGSSIIIQYLEQSVRSQIYSTSLPPAIIAATRKNLEIISSPKGQLLREKLLKNINYFKRKSLINKLNIKNNLTNHSPIQIIVFPNKDKLTKIADYLFEKNLLVGKMLYPTVPKNEPRLRISINVNHTKSDIDYLVSNVSTDN